MTWPDSDDVIMALIGVFVAAATLALFALVVALIVNPDLLSADAAVVRVSNCEAPR